MYVLGGGLGRDGGGISEPITAKSIFGREGLGKDIFQLSSNRILFYFVHFACKSETELKKKFYSINIIFFDKIRKM